MKLKKLQEFLSSSNTSNNNNNNNNNDDDSSNNNSLIEEPPSPILNVSSSNNHRFSNTLQTSPIINDNENGSNKTKKNSDNDSFMMSASGIKSDFSILVNGNDDENDKDEITSIESEVILSPVWNTNSMENITSIYLSQEKHICFQTKNKIICVQFK